MLPTIVYKLGGSLLTLPDLGQRLRRLLSQPLPFVEQATQAAKRRVLLIVGGGELADVVRRWDQIHQLGDDRAHELALRSMSLNARLVAAILGDARLITSRSEADDAWSRGSRVVLSAAEFLETEEKTHAPLPRTWDVTSDSVAAYVAVHWPADALVLIKSIPLPTGCHPTTAAHSKDVDAHFPQWAERIPHIGWANLRADEPAIVRWT